MGKPSALEDVEHAVTVLEVTFGKLREKAGDEAYYSTIVALIQALNVELPTNRKFAQKRMN